MRQRGNKDKRSVSSTGVKRPATNGETVKSQVTSDPRCGNDNHAMNVDISTDFNVKSLLQDVNQENEFIKWQINSIPPHIYFNNETMATVREKKHSVLDEKLIDLGIKRKHSRPSKKRGQKRVKLDPEQQTTVSGIIVSIGEMEAKNEEKLKKPKNSVQCMPDVNSGQPVTIDELKARLEAKIAALRGNSEASIKKREVNKLKRRMSKLNLKEKRKLEKKKITPVISNADKVKVSKMPPVKPVYNKEGQMVFSKFDFTEMGVGDKKKGEYSGKNYKRLLEKVEKNQEKIKVLEDKDAQKASQVKDKKKWKAALEKAEGLKVKNDPELLKKALKRHNRCKKKSAKEWDSRQEMIKEKQEKKQKKRKENIDARKQGKIKKKIKKSVKKGRIIPGFSKIKI